MTDSTLQAVTQPDTGATDPLHELLRQGARDLIAKAVEAELSSAEATAPGEGESEAEGEGEKRDAR